MSWVCSCVQWDGWLCPVAKPASVPESCPVPWELMGKACGATTERRAWRQEEVGRLVPHRCAAFEPCMGSSTVLLFHGKSLVAKEIGPCFGLKHPASTPFQKVNASLLHVLVLQIHLPDDILGGLCSGQGGRRRLRAVAGCPAAQQGAAHGAGVRVPRGWQHLAAWANKASAFSVQSWHSSKVSQHSHVWICEIPETRRSKGHRWSCALGEVPALAALVRWVASGWVLQLSPSCPISESWQD